MESIKIKGKTYYPVNERIKAFRAEKPGYALISRIVDLTDTTCTMQAEVRDPNGFVIATGTAREEKDDKTSMVNKTSFVENCETSAFGRALGNLGYGIDESFASADELVLALTQQGVESTKTEDKAAKPTQSKSERESLTLEKALQFKTTKGKLYGELTDDNLKYIIDNSKNDLSIEAATLILEDRQMCEDLQPIPVGEEGLPF